MTVKVKHVTTVVEFDDGTTIKFDVEEPRHTEFGLDTPDLDVSLRAYPAEWLAKITPPGFTAHHVSIRAEHARAIDVEWSVARKEPKVYCGIVGCKGHPDAIETCAIFAAIKES